MAAAPFMSASKGSDIEFLPFGSGRRMLANLVHRFDWDLLRDLPPGQEGRDIDVSQVFGLASSPPEKETSLGSKIKLASPSPRTQDILGCCIYGCTAIKVAYM